MTAATLATNSFGQNFNATMIQMVTAFCSLINGGNYYEPHVVSSITSPSGVVISRTEPRLLKKTISEDTSERIRDYTIQVVEGEYGTGETARPAGYRIGGKTGTAETIPRFNGEYVVSFMGYAPAEDPQIAVYVVVDRPNFENQDDATFATVIVRSIMQEVLPYLNIYMSEPVTDEERAELDELGIAVTYTGDEPADKWEKSENW
jgi:stage V sporulation protein D (sporulation-specific penicillin-binding protein)